jgi:hypothetical protein
LFEADEAFREMCEELTDADQALAACANMPALLRETRQAEWRELIARQVKDIEIAIQGAVPAKRNPTS